MPDSPHHVNPYELIIQTCENNTVKIQTSYEEYRIARNAQQKAKFLSPAFEGASVDRILQRIVNPTLEPGFVDTRNAMVFIARPPEIIKSFITECQQMLSEVVPNLWIVPQTSLHTTVLEIAHSRTPEEIASLVPQIRGVAPSILNHTCTHRTRLIKPLLCFDASAIALSFLPTLASTPGYEAYTYHHLRRDLFALARGSGTAIESRYAVPSAHMTLGRFICAEDLYTGGRVDLEKARQLVARIDGINAWLEREYWPGGIEAIEWVVGSEMGLEWRIGPVWYGSGGETLMVGETF
ncbi:RNA ligase/cyclic nucleotide phosphodiesterase [Mycena albidolilacea]|uniref:RNA ligase/cyclic nucleotide phosphodiesterase n=1 Tax=Mycena albidolilacea TaxID=1033008 RepID=A0AAD6ZUY7_9AGAR|nr:RNA ligase/cyclic nucleotide phosphodiesterase [Mycena albidolilacea]